MRTRLRRHGNRAIEAWERGLQRHGNESRNMDKIKPITQSLFQSGSLWPTSGNRHTKPANKFEPD